MSCIRSILSPKWQKFKQSVFFLNNVVSNFYGVAFIKIIFGGSYEDNFGATMAILQMLKCEVFESMLYTTYINK
jgi:hypothetical protein